MGGGECVTNRGFVGKMYIELQDEKLQKLTTSFMDATYDEYFMSIS